MTNKEKIDFVFNYYNRIRIQNILIWLGINICATSLLFILHRVNGDMTHKVFINLLFGLPLLILNTVAVFPMLKKVKFNKNYNNFGIIKSDACYYYAFSTLFDYELIGFGSKKKNDLNPYSIVDGILHKFNLITIKINKKKQIKKELKDNIVNVELTSFYEDADKW